MSDIIDVEAVDVTDRLSSGQQKISGYRDLSPEEIDLVNRIKAKGLEIQELVEEVTRRDSEAINTLSSTEQLNTAAEAMRWASIAKTHLQVGLMALTRAVTKPQGF